MTNRELWRSRTIPASLQERGERWPIQVTVASQGHVAGERMLKVMPQWSKEPLYIEVDHPERFSPGEELEFRWTGTKFRGGVRHTGTLTARRGVNEAQAQSKEVIGANAHKDTSSSNEALPPTVVIDSRAVEQDAPPASPVDGTDEEFRAAFGAPAQDVSFPEDELSPSLPKLAVARVEVSQDGERMIHFQQVAGFSLPERAPFLGSLPNGKYVLVAPSIDMNGEVQWTLERPLQQDESTPEARATLAVQVAGAISETELSFTPPSPVQSEPNSAPAQQEGSVPRLSEEKIIPFDPGLQSVLFRGGRLFVHSGETRYLITNAAERFLLPGDQVRVRPTNDREGEAVDIQYEGRSIVLGRLQYRGGGKPSQGIDRSQLQFVVRVPGQSGRLDKVRFSAEPVIAGMSDELIARLIHEDGFLKFKRDEMKLVDEPLWAEEEGSYRISRFAILTNLGAEEHDEEAEALRRNEEDQLAALKRRYGVGTLSDKKRRQVSERAAPAMESLIRKEARAGRLVDMREGRHTFAVDSGKTLIRDDAFSIGASTLGPEWNEIGIHIADPRALIPAGSAIDRASADRGSSIFLPDGTIALFPRFVTTLSSFEEGFDRRAFSLVFDARFDPDKGIVIRNLRFQQSGIRVSQALTPEQANQLREGTDEVAQAWRTLSSVIDALNRRTESRVRGKKPKHLRHAGSIVAAANRFFNQAAAYGFSRLKRSPDARLKRLQDAVQGVYERQVQVNVGGRRVRSEPSTQPGSRNSFKEQTSYLSSPLRHYSSLVGIRALGFLQKLQGYAGERKALSATQYRALAEEYATEVVGMPLSDEIRALPDDAFVEKVAEEARMYIEAAFTHVSERQMLAARSERALQAAWLLDAIGTDMYRRGGPVSLPEGITVGFFDRRQVPSPENGVTWVYGEARISVDENRSLYMGYAAPSARGELLVEVKFPLPEGMAYPDAPAHIHLEGRIMNVDLEANRLVLEVDRARDMSRRRQREQERQSSDLSHGKGPRTGTGSQRSGSRPTRRIGPLS